MKEYEYSKTNQKVYYEELDNGLKVYYIPDYSKNCYHLNLGTLFGSNDIEFIPVGKKEYVKMPLGIAHFLEHKNFDTENLEDPFAFFGKTGTNANAGTNFYSTRYYAWGTRDINSNLDFLISYVFSPYFTKESIDKEQGIIKEEIRMYEDDTDWILDDNARHNLFSVLPIKEKIAGTVSEIKKITKEDLYNCYDTFYQPSNMVLIINGTFNMDEVRSIIHQNKALNSLKSKQTFTRKEYMEPNNVVDAYQEIKGNVIIPKLRYAFKINRDIFSIKDPIILNMYLNALTSILFGQTSLFYERVKHDNITTGFLTDHGYYQNFYTLNIEAESSKPDVFCKYVDELLNNIKIEEIDLERVKRVWISSEVRLSDCLELVSDSVFDDIVRYGKPYFNRIDIIKKLNIDEFRQVIKELDFSNKTLVMLIPRENVNN